MMINIPSEQAFLEIIPFINKLALEQSLTILSTSHCEFHIEEGAPKFWAMSTNKVVCTMEEASTVISFGNAGSVASVATNCPVAAAYLKDFDNK